jgi:copper chaperone CopZ
MHRRNFMKALAGGSASVALLNLEANAKTPAENKPAGNATVAWTVKGFTCVTCAVGLQTILQQEKGIAKVAADYPSGKVQIAFDSRTITPAQIRQLIEKAGFKVQSEPQAGASRS